METTWPFPVLLVRVLIVSDANEHRVTKPVIPRPLSEPDFADHLKFSPRFAFFVMISNPRDQGIPKAGYNGFGEAVPTLPAKFRLRFS